MKELSVFDIIGPNMIGPSSSHTAGALKIAKVAYQLAPKKIEKVTFVLYGSFAKTYKGHGTDRALVAGILGMNEEDERIRDAFSYAKVNKLNYEFKTSESTHIKHPNTVDIIMEDQSGSTISITGSSIGGGAISIDKVNGVEVFFNGEYHTLLVSHKDQPGLAAHITNCLGNWKINIAYMRIYRAHKGEMVSTIVETDDPICNQVIEAISNHLAVRYARIIN
ncbi:MAG: L-serine ammonia-lyase, iron-sulfur-dependent, subunit beta [Cellulosilyticum sp.]|nr:L-serine ammonia-lyase, iron-sulfur-dependent, subunit beta [Cellulosilyticum sp.]